MIVDANMLLYAVDSGSPFHEPARGWVEGAFNGPGRVGLPWSVLTAFVRISTSPRAFAHPLSPSAAWGHVEQWLTLDNAWAPAPTSRHAEVLGSLIIRHDLRGNLISDADLAALAIEHGLRVCSADTDFARFSEVEWTNPLKAP